MFIIMSHCICLFADCLDPRPWDASLTRTGFFCFIHSLVCEPRIVPSAEWGLGQSWLRERVHGVYWWRRRRVREGGRPGEAGQGSKVAEDKESKATATRDVTSTSCQDLMPTG